MKKTKATKPKISYEPEADVLTWELSDKNIEFAKEIGNVIVHFTKNDTPVLIEILEARDFLANAAASVSKNKKTIDHKVKELAF